MKDKVKKWWSITLLTGIVVFLLMMGGVSVLNAIKPQNKPKVPNKAPHTRDYREGFSETSGENIPPAFIESSSVHKRLKFYDDLIYRLIPLPFLGMLAGAIYLIGSLICGWWKKGKKIL